jgi:hypothetical protein
MSSLTIPATGPAASTVTGPVTSTVLGPATGQVEHSWELRLEEFEDGQVVRRFECVGCGAVRFQ